MAFCAQLESGGSLVVLATTDFVAARWVEGTAKGVFRKPCGAEIELYFASAAAATYWITKLGAMIEREQAAATN
jgi:hypothetical protein